MRGGNVTWAALDDLSFVGVPTRTRIACDAVHPDRYRQAACSLDAGHDGYHATDDRRIEWQTADVSKAGGISCVTIDRAAGHQHVSFGPPLYPDDAMPFRPADSPYAAHVNRHARRAAKRGGRG